MPWKSLIICLLSLPCFAQAQNNSYLHELSFDRDTCQGYTKIEFPKSTRADSLLLHLGLRAFSDPNSFLHEQLREFQDVDFHFAKETELGFIKIDSVFQDGAKVSFKDSNGEFAWLPSKPETELYYHFALPSSEFTGNGRTESKIHLIDLLPRLAYWDSAWHHAPLTYHYDLNQSRDHFRLKVRSLEGMKAVSNLDLKQAPPRSDPFNWYHFEGEARSLQLHWSYHWHHYRLAGGRELITEVPDVKFPLELNNLIEQNKLFFYKECYDSLLVWKKLLLLEKKQGEYQSAQMLTLGREKDWFQAHIELVQAQAESFFRYYRYSDGWRNAWIARGIPYYYKYRFIKERYPDKRWIPFSNSVVDWFFALDEFDYGYQNRFLFLFLQRQGLDQNALATIDSLSRLNYEAIVQAKSQLNLAHLRAYTGDADFRRSMARFVHPRQKTITPQALRESFEYYSPKPLAWFFDTLILSAEIYDYQLLAYDHCPTVSTATVRNTGDLDIPYSLTGYKEGQAGITQWYQGHVGKRSVQLFHDDYDKVVLNHHLVNPENRLKNNTYFKRWLLPRMEPLSFQLYNSFEASDKSQVFYVPSVYYNAYDKLLLGVNFSNKSVLVQKPFEYMIIPEFSFGTSKLTGSASFRYNFILPKSNFFRQVSLGLYSRYYHYDQDLAYSRFSPSLNLYIRKSHPRSPYIQSIRLRGVQVNRELAPGFSGEARSLGNASFNVLNLSYRMEYTNILRPTILRSHFELGEQFGKFFAEWDQRWMLPNKKWLIWRNYAGLFLYNDLRDQGFEDNFYSIGISGTQDYLFDYYLIGRSDQSGIWSRQFFTSDGGFRTETGAFADRFLLSSNLSLPLYGPLGLFGDVGLSEEQFYWDYGVRLAFLTDFLELYFPLQNQNRSFMTEANYLSNLRFVLDFDLGNIINRARRGFY